MIEKQRAIRFLSFLSSNDWKEFTEFDLKRIESFVDSDGCTGVPDFYHWGCVLHDWCYRTHIDFAGSDITKDQADLLLRDYIRSKSLFGRFSPMAWWRWRGVKYLAERPWERYGE